MSLGVGVGGMICKVGGREGLAVTVEATGGDGINGILMGVETEGFVVSFTGGSFFFLIELFNGWQIGSLIL